MVADQGAGPDPGVGPQCPADIAVVGGCGRAGLPLAVLLAGTGRRVAICDTDRGRADAVARGQVPFREDGVEALLRQALASESLVVSTRPEAITGARTVVVVVGPPVDHEPAQPPPGLHGVVEELEPFVSEDALFVLRSTVPPGFTEWAERLFRSRGRSIDVAVCPERAVENRAVEEMTQLPQIIGASTARAGERAEELFSPLGIRTMRATPREAELAKLLANAWRYIRFAVANEFFMLANGAHVDYSRVLELVREDYPRAADLPAPGLTGGPCLPKDTAQLAYFAAPHADMSASALSVNRSVPADLVELLTASGGLEGSRVALLGLAFKADSDDARGSLGYRVRDLLRRAGAEVVAHDPSVPDADTAELDTALDGADTVIVGVPHAVYAGLQVGERRLLDIWGIVTGRIVCPVARADDPLASDRSR